MKKIHVFFLGLILAFLPVCSKSEQNNIIGSGDITSKSNDAFLNTANLTLRYLKDRDFKELSLIVHKDKGVVFSPYAFVEERAVKFTSAKLKALRLSDKFLWGVYDGSGYPMNLSVDDYFKSFIFDRDFTQAQQIGIDRLVKTGNTISNIDQVFPKGRFIEYHFPGFDPAYVGMDWASLRLVFEEVGGEFMLVCVVHDAWTI